MKTAFTQLALIAMIMADSISSYAQPHPKQDKIRTLKVSFITNRLDLTPSEAEKFWPVYNEFQKEMDKILKARAENMEGKNLDAMPDKEIEIAIDKQMDSEQNEMEMKRTYHAKFKEVLPMKKVALLYLAERDFKVWILEVLKKRREDNNKRPFNK